MDIVFREGQRQVMEYKGGWMAVPSVPGAGKTFTLSQLAVKIIGEGRHLPGKILIVTYMNSAVANFKQRISESLKKAGLNPVQGYEVMTLHSLAMKILKEKPDGLWIADDFTVLDELRQVSLVKELINQWIDRNQRAFESLVDIKDGSHTQLQKKLEQWRRKFNTMAADMISYFKSLRLEEEQLLNLVRGLPDDAPLKWCAEIYARYQRILKNRGEIDFADILNGALLLLKQDREILDKYQKRYTYIFEDEAQDSTHIQQEILMLLAQRSGNLLRVGDSNQAIMSTFTVSDPKLFQSFCQHPNTQVQSILVASRSCKHILNLANYLVKWTRNSHPIEGCRSSLEEQYIAPVGEKDPHPNPTTPRYSVACREFDTFDEEVSFVARHAARFIEEYPDKTVAVLAPKAEQINRIRDALEERKVPYKEITRYPKERAYTSDVLGTLLDFLATPSDNKKFVEAARLILPHEEGELNDLFHYLGSDNLHLEELFYPLTGSFDERQVPEAVLEKGEWARFKEWIPFFKELLNMSWEMPEYLILHIAERLGFSPEQMAIAQKIASDVRYLMSLNPRWSLLDLAQELKEIQNSFNYFANIVYDMQGYEAKPGEVTLATYHKAKGLEWDTVFLTSVTAGDFPAFLSDPYLSDYGFLKEEYRNPVAVVKAQLASLLHGVSTDDPVKQARMDTIGERLRLLYVGITRAKENLVLTAHRSYAYSDWTFSTKPSHYFNVLKKYIMEQEAIS